MMQPLRVQVLTEPWQLLEIAAAWSDLLGSSRHPEPMLHPAWLLTWWKYYGSGRSLRVTLFYDGDRLIGIAPLCRRVHYYRPGIPFRRLEFLGSDSNLKSGVYSEYLGLIALEGFEPAIAKEFVEQLTKNAFGSWDECSFEMMNSEDIMTTYLFECLSRSELVVECTVQTDASYLTLPKDWDSYLSKVHGKRRNWFRHTMRAFNAWVGERGYRLCQATDTKSLREGFEILANLHEERWRAAGGTGAFRYPCFRKFHEDYTSQMLSAGKLELAWLTVGDEPVAAMYNIIGTDKLYFYQSGRRMSVPSHVRIGIVMFVLMLQQAMSNGYREFDFLGGEVGYKTRFTSQSRPLIKIRVAQPVMVETLRRLLKSTRDTWLDFVRRGKCPRSKPTRVPGGTSNR
jgi:CelD/BcsL family acetyltransferase involved in cellulose biosynthesis